MTVHNFFQRLSGMTAGFAVAIGLALGAGPAQASGEKLAAKATTALSELKAMKPGVGKLADEASAVLVIPEITKASLVVGGAYGEGVLMIGGEPDSYWSYSAASLGFQAGAQQTRQAMFFMTDDALTKFKSSKGFEFGADLEATVIDKGAGVAIDTTKDRAPVIVFVYGREGLQAGASVQGGKYERLQK